MKHIVLNEYGKAYKINDEVLITNKNHSMYKKFGEIYKIRNYDNNPRISVVFETGDVYSAKPSDFKHFG